MDDEGGVTPEKIMRGGKILRKNARQGCTVGTPCDVPLTFRKDCPLKENEESFHLVTKVGM